MKSEGKRLVFDRSQIIFSASKGETANRESAEPEISLIYKMSQEDKEMAMSELDFSELVHQQ